MSMSTSLGYVFELESNSCSRLTLCVAVDTGVTRPSFSRR